MDNDEFMKLMNELCIPDENIIECHEPEDSLETLRNLETQYGVDTTSVIVNNDSLITNHFLPTDVFKKWTDTFNTFMEYHGDASMIDSHSGEYIVPSINTQGAEFVVNSAPFFVQ